MPKSEEDQSGLQLTVQLPDDVGNLGTPLNKITSRGAATSRDLSKTAWPDGTVLESLTGCVLTLLRFHLTEYNL